jgi:amicyanin
MYKKIGALICIVLGVGIFFFFFVSQISKKTMEPNDSTPLSQATTTNGTASTTPDIVATKNERVTIKGYVFAPATLKVRVGDTVTWTNKDEVRHSVDFDDGSFDSPLLAQDQTASHTFTVPGTYSYYCGPHPYMKASITVLP